MKPYINREENQYLNALPIYKHIRFQILNGWIDFVYDKGKEIMECCDNEGLKPYPTITQVKRKNGTLEILINTKNLEVNELIYKIKEESKMYCELCGEKGSMQYNIPMKGIFTLCQKHTIKGFEVVS